MNNHADRIDSIKLTIGKDGKLFYYHKSYNETYWTKISKPHYDNYLKDYSVLAIETEKDEAGNVVFMKYKNENSSERKVRLYRKDFVTIKHEEYQAARISLVKKTLGKDGKYYHYESLSAVNNVEDVHWYKIDESYFNFHIDQYKALSIKTDQNEKGEIIYMEYEFPQKKMPQKKKGCLMSVVFTIVLITIILSI